MQLSPIARRSATLLAIVGLAACESTPTAPAATPRSAAPEAASHDLQSNAYTSGSNVTAYDPIPGGTDTNWPTSVCTNTPAISLTDARWQNPHNAFVLGGHPWANTIPGAAWINAWNSIQESVLPFYYPTAGFQRVGSSDYYNWTKYETTVQGNGNFQIQLLADNCSWVYIDGTLVGVQPANWNANNITYGLTLNGTHRLSFLIFDGGGAAGGQFKLQTTSVVVPPLNPDLDGDGTANTSDNCPLIANADQADMDQDVVGDACDPDIDGDGVSNEQDAFPTDPTRSAADNTAPTITHTITGGTPNAAGWYNADVTVTFDVNDPESTPSLTGCDVQHVSTTTAADGVTLTCSATSAGGTADDQVTIKLDKTVPTVTGTPSGPLGANGWYIGDVAVTWTPSAAGPSGQTLSPECAQNTLTTDSPSSTFTCTVTTGAELSSAPGSVTVKRDATKPLVSLDGNAGTYTIDQTVTITCSISDAMSGVAAQSCSGASGAAYAIGLGAHAISASASDYAGNSQSVSGSFTVVATTGSVCALVQRWVTQNGIANSLCVKLNNAQAAFDRGNRKAGDNQLDAFVNEVDAQTGKAIAADKASILKSVAQTLN